MKIRNGFVSNSSSSSFVILGTCVTKQEEVMKLLNITKEDLDRYDNDHWLYKVDGILSENDYMLDGFDVITDNDSDSVYIGELLIRGDDTVYDIPIENVRKVLAGNNAKRLEDLGYNVKLYAGTLYDS